MFEDDSSANIEWEQGKSVDKNTRVSRRLDLKKAKQSESSKRTDFSKNPTKTKILSPNLKRIQSKIHHYDEDEDEDDDEVVFHFSLNSTQSSLLTALKEEEKASLQTKRIKENQKMQIDAGKMNTVLQAEATSQKLGLKKLTKKVVANTMQEASFNENVSKIVAEDAEIKTKIKAKDLSTKQTHDLVKGLQKMRLASLTSKEIKLNQLENMKTKDLIDIGKSENDAKTAKLILEKSGRKEVKKASKIKKEHEVKKIKKAIKQAKAR